MYSESQLYEACSKTSDIEKMRKNSKFWCSKHLFLQVFFPPNPGGFGPIPHGLREESLLQKRRYGGYHIASFFGNNISSPSCSESTKRYLTKPSEVYRVKTMQKKMPERIFDLFHHSFNIWGFGSIFPKISQKKPFFYFYWMGLNCYRMGLNCQ